MHLFFFNLHGLIRKNRFEIGRDADNGGQIAYVMELAKELSEQSSVSKITLFTRLIDDPTCSSDYAQPIEKVNERFEIRRIACGGKKYLPKEKLWPHLDEYVTNALQHIRKEKLRCDWMHGHYADAGYVAAELSKLLNIPFFFTSHSLGRIKKERMKNTQTSEQLMRSFRFEERIPAEEEAIGGAQFVVTSTRQEQKSYSVYHSYPQTKFEVIPPGTDLNRFSFYLADQVAGNTTSAQEMRATIRIQQELERFLTHPGKPLILALCRPDKRKNIEGVVEAYGRNQELQAIANLAIFAGIRKDIRGMGEAEKEVLTELLLMMDAFDLYGKMAIPKQLDVSWEVPEIYRIAARKKGVFVNAAFVEPFGLTILEAAASGLPVLATKHGGPTEILDRLENGMLVDPRQPEEISSKLIEMLSNNDLWSSYSLNGMERVKQHYSWGAHAQTYLAKVSNALATNNKRGATSKKESDPYSRIRRAKKLLVCDIDGTMIDSSGENSGLDELRSWIEKRDDETAFGYATGRNIPLIQEVIERHNLPQPDFAIHSVGTEILFDLSRTPEVDRGWRRHIAHQWDRALVVDAVNQLPGLELQQEELQNSFKASWIITDGSIQQKQIQEALGRLATKVQIIISQHRYLDILPKRASKGRALRYLAQKWDIPLSQIIVCGDSGNDLDLLTCGASGVVVGGYSSELEPLKKRKELYFSPDTAAAGILDGLRHYGWR